MPPMGNPMPPRPLGPGRIKAGGHIPPRLGMSTIVSGLELQQPA